MRARAGNERKAACAGCLSSPVSWGSAQTGDWRVMVLSCLLCHSATFTDLSSLISALSSLTRCRLVCPLSHCGHTELGLDNMVQHLSSHQAADNIDNIEQVIRDLEDLVQTDITLKTESPALAPAPVPPPGGGQGQGESLELGDGGWLTERGHWSGTPAVPEFPASVPTTFYPPAAAGSLKISHNNLTMKGTSER